MRDQELIDSLLKEDDTVATATESLSDSDGECESLNSDTTTQLEIGLKEKDEIRGVDDYLLQVHGLAPGREGEGVTRVLYENRNGLNNRLSRNEKLDKARQIYDNLEADVVAGN